MGRKRNRWLSQFESELGLPGVFYPPLMQDKTMVSHEKCAEHISEKKNNFVFLFNFVKLKAFCSVLRGDIKY